MTEKKTKTTEAQKRATQAYRERNREKTNAQAAKSMTKTYINKYCDLDALEEVAQWIENRKKELQNE